jgi:hypothetical protein
MVGVLLFPLAINDCGKYEGSLTGASSQKKMAHFPFYEVIFMKLHEAVKGFKCNNCSITMGFSEQVYTMLLWKSSK